MAGPGGRRPGSGGKPGNQNARKAGDGRQFARGLVDNPVNRKLVAKAFQAALRSADPAEAVAVWDRIFQAAYGRPPQALDVNLPPDAVKLEFVLPGGVVLPASATGLSGPDADERG